MPQSTWQRVRFVIDPSELLSDFKVRLLSLEEMGFLMRLAAFGTFAGVPTEPDKMAHIAGVSTYKARRMWPSVEQFFQLSASGMAWELLPLPWAKTQIISSDRRDLTALLDALVDYWGPRCAYCGAEGDLEVEHIIPLARGGTNEITNLTVACHGCNNKKRTKTAEEFGHPHIHKIAAKIQ